MTSALAPDTAAASRTPTAPSPGAAGTGAEHRRPRRIRPNGFLWILPALVVSGGIVYFCIGYNAWASMFDWNGISPNPKNVGTENFRRALQDPIFWGAIRHTIVYFIVTFLGQTILGVLLAALLHSRVHFAALYKVIVFVPVVLAPAIMAPVFRILFSGDGPVNTFLEAVGLGFIAQPWLAQSGTALGVLMIMQIWQSTGISFILYYSAMGQIEGETLEAARIDGAGNLRMLWSIILPGMRGTVVALAMLTAIASLKLFDIPFLVTQGGPNYATEFLGTYIYRQAVPFGDVGYSSALSILLLVLAVAMAALLNSGGREKNTKNEKKGRTR